MSPALAMALSASSRLMPETSGTVVLGIRNHSLNPSGGSGKSSTGRSTVMYFMNWAQIGAVSVPPNARS